jgi:hypothetical protein
VAGCRVKIVPGDDDIRDGRGDARHVSDFEQLRGIAMTGPQTHVGLRYTRERQAQRKTSSRAEKMAELAAAAREKHRGLFAGFDPARG